MFNFNKQKQIFFVVILFVVGLFVVDRLLYIVVGFLYSKTFSGPGMYNFFMSEKNQCIILGSSTAKAYLTEELVEKIGFPVVNISKNGSSIIYSYCLLLLLEKHDNLPEIVVLNIDYFEVTDKAWGGDFYHGIESLSPFYGEIDYVDNALIKDKFQNKIKFFLKTYRYNNKLFSILRKNITKDVYQRELPSNTEVKLPLRQEDIDDKFNQTFKIDIRKIEIYEEIIRFCQKNKIKIFLIESPVFCPNEKSIKITEEIREIFDGLAFSHGVKFMSFNAVDYPAFRSSKFFSDILHLNYSGGQIFTDYVAGYLLDSLSDYQ